MPARQTIPRKTIYRLSIYLRCLQPLRDNGQETVSSAVLAKIAGVSPSQLRKDFSHLGPFGKRGLGYPVRELLERLTVTLGTNRLQPVVLIGAGRLGSALLTYQGFAKAGFEVVAAFDLHPRKASASTGGVEVLPMDRLATSLATHKVRIAILSVPGAHAQLIVSELIPLGIEAILNFAPVVLDTPPHVVVNNVNLAIELENLAFFLRQ